MDINTLRGLATLFALVAFLSVCCWAYSGRKKKDFDEAAHLPFADEPRQKESNSDNADDSVNNNKGANTL